MLLEVDLPDGGAVGFGELLRRYGPFARVRHRRFPLRPPGLAGHVGLARGEPFDLDGDAARRGVRLDGAVGEFQVVQQLLDERRRLLQNSLHVAMRQFLDADLDQQRVLRRQLGRIRRRQRRRRLRRAARSQPPQGEAHGFALRVEGLGAPFGHRTTTQQETSAFRDGKGATGVEQVERVRQPEAVIVGGLYKPEIEQPSGLAFPQVKHLEQLRRVRRLEVVLAVLDLLRVEDVAVGDAAGRPGQVVDALDALQVHGDALDAIRQFAGAHVELEPAALLEVGELEHFHAVEPGFPAEAPCAERGALPVVLDEAEVVSAQVQAQRLERLQEELLHIRGRRLQDDLILVVVLQPIGVLAVASIRRARARLRVRDPPGLRTQRAEKRGRVGRSRADFRVVRLPEDAALVLPETVQRLDDLLHVHCEHPLRSASRGLARDRRSGLAGAVRGLPETRPEPEPKRVL